MQAWSDSVCGASRERAWLAARGWGLTARQSQVTNGLGVGVAPGWGEVMAVGRARVGEACGGQGLRVDPSSPSAGTSRCPRTPRSWGASSASPTSWATPASPWPPACVAPWRPSPSMTSTRSPRLRPQRGPSLAHNHPHFHPPHPRPCAPPPCHPGSPSVPDVPLMSPSVLRIPHLPATQGG